MDIKAVRKVVGNIKASLFKNSNSFSIGMLKSHFRGSGLQFKEHQIYTHGDDVRFIDWKMLAKTNTPYIKTFEEERNVEIVVVLDATQSMLMGYKNVSKLQAAIEVTCLLYLLAKETGDYVHVLLLTDEIINIPKKSGDGGIIQLVSILENKKILNDDGKVNVGLTYEKELDSQSIISNILRYLSKSREVVILSDFIDSIEIDDLNKIVFRNNLHCFQFLSPLDEKNSLPFSFYGKGNSKKKRNKYFNLNTEVKHKEEDRFKKRIKKLRVQNRYLEEFIKEML